ncbi:MAG TPA: methyltransferase domain-containing protein, partial [Terriglobales bacterium]|nr:methyltransferase domain-containing protein [Terriglobales bacterium]
FLFSFTTAVLSFFIAGLLYLLCFEHVDNLGAYSIPSETGLLIPSDFDAVVNLISFHHYPNPDKAIAEFRRVLRPGGRLVLIAFDLDSHFIQFAQQINRWTRNIAGDAWQKHGEEVAALVRHSGFTSVELKPVRYWFKTFLIVADTAPEP